MQGGFVAAAIDNTLGPLAYLVAPPSVTLQLSTQYLRPVAPDSGHIVVHGRVEAMTKSYLYLSARVLDPQDRVLAFAQTSCQILPPRED
jgi:acyl-coenzyme A thioesterase PaaI-like protein